MISTDFNFLEFLGSLDGLSRDDIIVKASRESRAAKDSKERRGNKVYNARLYDYVSDLGTFLHFVRNSHNSGMSWPDAFLASSEWRNIQRARYGSLLDND